jgi:hypothetical protein
MLATIGITGTHSTQKALLISFYQGGTLVFRQIAVRLV